MTDKITHEDFTKIDLRIGQIKKAEKHPRGIESNGMILAGVSDNKEEINILSIEEKVPAGTKVS